MLENLLTNQESVTIPRDHGGANATLMGSSLVAAPPGGANAAAVIMECLNSLAFLALIYYLDPTFVNCC